MAHLTFLKEGKSLLQRPLDQNQIWIGRDNDCDIQLFEPEISRRHCCIERENGDFLLKDFSRNGTYVNQKRVEKTPLNPFDQIQIGPWQLLFAIDERPSSTDTVVLEKNKKKKTRATCLGAMFGASRPMKRVFEQIQKAAKSLLPVCLIGESGTGKELAARLIHDLSERKDKPFVAINCGAIPANLIESLLFGHEKGSFTGATERQPGVFEQADTGTLFLDEIGEMPLELQTRLLRVLENQTIRRIGSRMESQVDVRLVAATLRDLKEGVATGRFREDLFFRLFVFPITLPPLKERMEDLGLLVDHFLKTLSPAKKIMLAPEAFAKLKKYDWPGNVRELKNALQRAMLLAKKKTIEAKEIELSHLTLEKESLRAPDLAAKERQSILEALRKTRGNQLQAAKVLGIARTTLASKLKRYVIDPEFCS